MGKLTQDILRKIEAAKEFDDIKDWIWMAGDLLRLSASAEYHSGFAEIDQEKVSVEEAEALKTIALSALKRNTDSAWIASFLSVLRDSHDPELLPLWIDYLTKFQSQMKEANVIVFTILLALREIDQPIFVGARSLDSGNIEGNLKEADNYLRRHNILIPG